MLAELGAGVVDSDALGRNELRRPDIEEQLCRWWGRGILHVDGGVDRKKVASIVFGDPSQRRRLEALIHPRIADRRNQAIADFEKRPDIKAVVLDSPLLFESDLHLICDAVIFVDAGLDVRRQRSEKERNWSADELARRENSQQPLDMKRARADYVCVNNSTPAALRDEVAKIFAKIVTTPGLP